MHKPYTKQTFEDFINEFDFPILSDEISNPIQIYKKTNDRSAYRLEIYSTFEYLKKEGKFDAQNQSVDLTKAKNNALSQLSDDVKKFIIF